MTSPAFDDIQDTVTKLLSAATPDACFKVFDDAIRQRGYAGFGFATDEPHIPAENRLVMTISRQWREEYLREGFLNIDPVFTAARYTCAPISWADARQGTGLFAHIPLHPRAPEVMNRARDHGYADGLTLPIHYGNLITVTSCFIQESTDREAVDISVRHSGEASLLILHLRERLSVFLERPGALPGLTPCQMEALRWVSAGKTNSEIAVIMGMSDHTVSWHLRQAMSRLQVHTRAQAAARAIQLGILNP
jgi:DNA-binding CsgD family transcriptional regulator